MQEKIMYHRYVKEHDYDDYGEEEFYYDIHYTDENEYHYEPEPMLEAIHVYTNRYPREEDDVLRFDSLEDTGIDLYFAPNCPTYEARRVVGEYNSRICDELSNYMEYESYSHGKFFTIYRPEDRDESGEIPESELGSMLKYHVTRTWVDGYGDEFSRTFERNPIMVFHEGVCYSMHGTTLYYAPECTEDEAEKICSRLNSKIRDCADDIYHWYHAPYGIMFDVTHPSTD